MKVIFTQSIQGVATKGDIKNVKPGFYRNYLSRFKKATPATEAALKQWEELRKKMMIEKEELMKKLGEMKRRFAETKLYIEKKITKKGTLYGGIKAIDIVTAIKEQLSIDIPESAVVIKKPIKTAGAANIQLKLGEGIEIIVPVEVLEKK